MFKSLYTRIAIYTITVMIFCAIASFLCTNIIYHNYLKENNDAKIMRTLKDSIQYQKQSQIKAPTPFFNHLGEMNYQVMTISENGHRAYYGTQFRKDNISQKTAQSVLSGKDYHGIKNLPYNPIITGFF